MTARAGGTEYPEYQHSVVMTKSFDEDGWPDGMTIKVEAHLHYIIGNRRPHFSVTAEVKEPCKREPQMCGCLHELVLEYWPELAPVVALHGSTDDGVPMHAEQNGLYRLGFTEWGGLKLSLAAQHFRIPLEEVEPLRDHLISGSGYDPEKYATYIADCVPRWKAEADAAIKLLEKLA
jgi:hypothetical protein